MVLDNTALDTILRTARTYSRWQDKDVPETILQEIYDLAKMGPTAANTSPMRVVFVKSREAKERMRPFLDKGNVDKTMAAPVTAIFGCDRRFYDHLPRLFPHADAKSWYEGNEPLITKTMWRNATLQAAYFMIAARAMGLDCGPMSGFDHAKMKQEFMPDLDGDVNFICNLGYGDASALHPRLPRFDFDEVCKIV